MAEEKQKYTISLTEDEVQQEIADLRQDEEMNLFLKVQNGGKKFEKYAQLIKLLEKDEPKE